MAHRPWQDQTGHGVPKTVRHSPRTPIPRPFWTPGVRRGWEKEPASLEAEA